MSTDHSKKPLTMVGAKSLVVLESKTYNQELWIFGEFHKLYDKKDCKIKPDITLIEYITTMLSKGKFYDVFIELSYKRKLVNREMYEVKTQIDLINNLLINCYTSTCLFNIRLHYFDVRTQQERYYFFNNLDNTRDEFIRWIDLDDETEKPSETPAILDLLETLLEGTENIVDKSPEQFQQFFGITKYNKTSIEIDRIDTRFSSEKVRLRKMYNEIVSEYKNIISDGNKLLPNIKQFISDQSIDNELNLLNSMDIYFNTFLDTTSKLTDIYTLARMFHQFKDSSKNQTSTVERAIYFGGSSHSDRIVSYLEESGFTQLFKSMNDSGCIEVPNVE